MVDPESCLLMRPITHRVIPWRLPTLPEGPARAYAVGCRSPQSPNRRTSRSSATLGRLRSVIALVFSGLFSSEAATNSATAVSIGVVSNEPNGRKSRVNRAVRTAVHHRQTASHWVLFGILWLTSMLGTMLSRAPARRTVRTAVLRSRDGANPRPSSRRERPRVTSAVLLQLRSHRSRP